MRVRSTSVKALSATEIEEQGVDPLFMVWLVSRSTNDLLDTVVGPAGVTGDEFAIYSVLAASPGITPGELSQVDGRTAHHSVQLRETVGRARAPHAQTPPERSTVLPHPPHCALGAEPTNTRSPSSGPSGRRSSRPSTIMRVRSGSRCCDYGASLTHFGATLTTQMAPNSNTVECRSARDRPSMRLG